MEKILEAKNAYKVFDKSEKNKVGILKGIDLQVNQEEFAAIMGRSGQTPPDIIFGDKPAGALKTSAFWEIMNILNEINQQGTILLIVTHDYK